MGNALNVPQTSLNNNMDTASLSMWHSFWSKSVNLLISYLPRATLPSLLPQKGAPLPPGACVNDIPQPNDPSVAKQSYVLEGTGDWGSGVHRSCQGKNGLIGITDPSVVCLWDNFRAGVKKGKNRPCVGYRKMTNGVAGEYVFYSYGEVENKALALGSAMRHVGIQKGQNVGIYSKNSVEWVFAEQSCNAFGHPTVAIYDTFGADAVCYIINHAELSIIFAESSKLDAISAVLEEGAPCVKHVVAMGDVAAGLVEKFAGYGVTLHSLDSFSKLGTENLREADPPTQDDIAILMYTSGTTGNPKGVIMTNFNMISTTNAASTAIRLVDSDVYFSFLPLAHCFERIIQCVVFRVGACIGIYSGDIRKLPEDIKELRPTLFVGVPRVFNRFYEKVLHAVQTGSGLKRALFNRAYASRKAALAQGKDTPVYNAIIFNKLRAILGGRVRIMATGSAPLDTRVHEFLRVCFCPVVMQGYGLTETCAGTVVQYANDIATGSIGHPLAANDFKLEDCPEMGYSTKSDPPQGELLIKGNGVFQYYYKDEERTKEEKTEDGWFHTGDIAQWNNNGSLSIVDRKKNIFKLSQGEYIAVESLEMVYHHAQHVAQMFVYGDSLQPFILAAVVPDEEQLMKWAKQNQISGDFKAVCENPATKKLLLGELKEQAKIAKLKGFEHVRGIVVHHELFSVANDMMTPTFKLRRVQATKLFKKQFDMLYEELNNEGKK